MFDDNCSLWTAAGLYNEKSRREGRITNITPTEVSAATGAMLGPARNEEQIKSMFESLGLQGDYRWFDNIGAAEGFINIFPFGTWFGFGYTSLQGSNGHIINAVRGLGSVTYIDYQIRERGAPYAPITANRPVGFDRYIVYSQGDPVVELTHLMAALSL